MNCNRNWIRSMVLICSLLLVITACGGQQAKTETQEAPAQQDPPLAKKYQHIVVSDFTSTPEIKKDYPDALSECQTGLIGALESSKSFRSVARAKAGMKYPVGSLIVQANVPEMRIVHGAARFWGGAFAGSSFMNLDLKLVDAATGKIVREKPISSANNAWAASWMGGSSDRSMPSDMGKIIAEYIGSVMPK